MTGVGVVVAKKKVEPKRKPGPKPNPEGRRGSLFTMKCHDAFKAWLTAYAKEKRHTPSQLVEIALIQMAKADGYPEPPER